MTLRTRIFLLAPLAIVGMLLVGTIFYFGDRTEQRVKEAYAAL